MKKIINNNLLNLIKGELLRAVKYKILTIGLSVSFLWVIILFFMRKNTEDMAMMAPMLIFTDAAVMSVMLIGAGIFFEKQEGSVRSLLISPVTIGQILTAKIINANIISLCSSLLVGVSVIIMSDISINIPLLLLYTVIVVAAHAAIGFGLALLSKDFNSMLINYMLFTLIFIMPPMLLMMRVIPEEYSLFMIISPSEAASVLLNSAVGSGAEWYRILLSAVYLIAITALVMRFMVYPRFKKDAMRG